MTDFLPAYITSRVDRVDFVIHLIVSRFARHDRLCGELSLKRVIDDYAESINGKFKLPLPYSSARGATLLGKGSARCDCVITIIGC